MIRPDQKWKVLLILIAILWAFPNVQVPKTPANPAESVQTRLLLRWGVWLAYSEWRPDQPHEDWSGNLSAEGGIMHNPQLVIYHGSWAPQRRTLIPLKTPQWQSPHIDFRRPRFGYKGLEGLIVDVEGDENTLLHFRSSMLDIAFRLGDIPAGRKLNWPAGPKYSGSQLVVCRIEDEGIYWNAQRAAEEELRSGNKWIELGLESFRGDFLQRELHHRMGAWIPPGGTIDIPFHWQGQTPVIATWRFAGTFWAPGPDTMGEIYSGTNSPMLKLSTSLNGNPLSTGKYKAKFMRGGSSGLEHTDELVSLLDRGENLLSITNQSDGLGYIVLYGVSVRAAPDNWDLIKDFLPFQADWFDGRQMENEDFATKDLPSGNRGIIVGYDTNILAAENGWIDSVIKFQAKTGAGNFVLFRTETDRVGADDWRRWFKACRDNRIYFALRTDMADPALPAEQLMGLAAEIGGDYFLGVKNHELSLPLYAGRREVDYPSTMTLEEAELGYIRYVKESYHEEKFPRLLGEAALYHRYDYKAGVNLILSETMTGNTSILLAEARGAARAFGRELWGMHIACHVHSTPEGWHQERMFWLNLYLGYLSGASILEDEEGALAKVHSFVSGPTDPLPAARRKNMAEFIQWAKSHPRTSPLTVDIGFLYGRHEAITGGMSLNTERPVRVWEGFGPAAPEWEYGRPEYGWLLMDTFLPGVWLCPVLRDESSLRRWFAGTPYGQVDVVPIEADRDNLSRYKLLFFPGWHTMNALDMEKFMAFVAGGGTLILGIPHLQTSPDRTAVLSRPDWSFVDPRLIERLCGLKVKGPGISIKSGRIFGQNWNLEDPRFGPLLMADIVLSGGRAAVELEGLPLVVEHRIGKGRTLTFCAHEYFGHSGLRALAQHWLERLAGDLAWDVRLEGGDGEVAYFVYPVSEESFQVYLINTDWTVPGNTKSCRLISKAGNVLEVKVTEGEVTEVLL